MSGEVLVQAAQGGDGVTVPGGVQGMWHRGLVGMAVMGWWLNLMAGLDALKDSMIL